MLHLKILLVIFAFGLLLEKCATNGQSFEQSPFNGANQYKLSNDDSVTTYGESGNHVAGTLYQMFIDTGAVLIVKYDAGINGYVAKYEYKIPPPDLSKPFFASAGFLKTAAG